MQTTECLSRYVMSDSYRVDPAPFYFEIFIFIKSPSLQLSPPVVSPKESFGHSLVRSGFLLNILGIYAQFTNHHLAAHYSPVYILSVMSLATVLKSSTDE